MNAVDFFCFVDVFRIITIPCWLKLSKKSFCGNSRAKLNCKKQRLKWSEKSWKKKDCTRVMFVQRGDMSTRVRYGTQDKQAPSRTFR